MIVEHLPDGRTLLDLEALAGLTGRTRETIRRHCGAGPYDARAAERQLDGVSDVVARTATEAARWLGIPVGTVWSWASRGLVTAVGTWGASPTYALDDLTKLAKAMPRRLAENRRLDRRAPACNALPAAVSLEPLAEAR